MIYFEFFGVSGAVTSFTQLEQKIKDLFRVSKAYLSGFSGELVAFFSNSSFSGSSLFFFRKYAGYGQA